MGSELRDPARIVAFAAGSRATLESDKDQETISF
jgi:hypothetical protein